MKWALLSDIHANLHALQACMAHARQQGVDKWAVLGDIVGYGGEPLPVVETIMQLHHEGAVVLQGNHDAMAVSPPQAEGSLGAIASAWTYQQLPPACRRFLAHIPLTPCCWSTPARTNPKTGATSTTNATPNNA
jgi:hypothetical protein